MNMTGIKMKAWDVYQNGSWIDTVYFLASCSQEYVRNSLINHDNFDSDIIVVPFDNKQ